MSLNPKTPKMVINESSTFISELCIRFWVVANQKVKKIAAKELGLVDNKTRLITSPKFDPKVGQLASHWFLENYKRSRIAASHQIQSDPPTIGIFQEFKSLFSFILANVQENDRIRPTIWKKKKMKNIHGAVLLVPPAVKRAIHACGRDTIIRNMI